MVDILANLVFLFAGTTTFNSFYELPSEGRRFWIWTNLNSLTLGLGWPREGNLINEVFQVDSAIFWCTIPTCM